MACGLKISLILSFLFLVKAQESKFPIVINTWAFTNANAKAWDVINRQGRSAIDAVVEGCAVCEEEQCDGSVGFGGSPNEKGETTLDAMVMDGRNMKVGAVASLRYIKDAISVARHVLEYTKHTLLVGVQATEFALAVGFQNQSLSTPRNEELISNWRNKSCQPNYWMNVSPSPESSCGPYEKMFPLPQQNHEEISVDDLLSHDTIGMVAIDKNKNVAVGTSTNGATYKIPGRVGDSAIVGSGGYADNKFGGAAATGDGDVMMRFSPTFLAVEFLRNGLSPKEAAEKVIERIQEYYPMNYAAVVVVDVNGNYGAACLSFNSFPYSIFYPGLNQTKVEVTECRKLSETTATEKSAASSSFKSFSVVLIILYCVKLIF